MIDGAEVEVSFSSSVISRRLTTKMWSCPPRQTPPSWPVIQSFGSGFGQDASIANCGASCACTTDGGTAAANKRAIARNVGLGIDFTAAPSLFKFSAAEVNRLEGAHVGDVIERVSRQDQEICRLTLGERAELLVDAKHLGIALGERLDDLHGCEARIPHQLHLPVLEPALNEIAIGRTPGVRAETNLDAGVEELLEVALVSLEHAQPPWTIGIVCLLLELLCLEQGQPLG